jgi:hypothetical protein
MTKMIGNVSSSNEDIVTNEFLMRLSSSFINKQIIVRWVFFSLQEYGTISDEAVIVGVKDESLDVYLFRIGVPLRVGINVREFFDEI